MMVYIILLSYLAFIFLGSLIGVKSKDATPESYFLADRNLTTISLFFTILATNFSAFYFLGFAGEGYKVGYAHYVMMALGTAFAGLSFIILGTRVWKIGKIKGYITPAELIYGQSGDRPLSYLYSGVMIVFTLPYLALQIVGGGYILESITGGDINYTLSVILLTIVTIVYVVIGGMQSVARTDLKQGLLMIVFMFLAVVWVGSDLGGITQANKEVLSIDSSLFEPSGKNGFYSGQKWFSFLIFWFFCIPMFPQLFMRFYIAKDLNILRKSAVLYAFIPLVISIFPVMIGVWGHTSFPGLEGKAADQILPMMLVRHTSEWFSALVMTGAIAAFMSTLDSQLLALSTMITRDFYVPVSGRQPDFKKEVLIGRVLVAILACLGMLIAFKPFDTIFDMGKMAFSGLAILFPLSYALIKGYTVQRYWAFSSVIVPLVMLFLFYYQVLPTSICLGFEYFVLIIIIAIICVSVGVRMANKK